MLKTRIIPCLLLKGTSLIKTTNFRNANYIGDPINAVHLFNQMEVSELIVLDTEATIQKRKPAFELIGNLASECFIPFSYGGGIQEIEDIKKILRLGVEKIVINTYAFENPYFIQKAAEKFGSQSIIVSIDVKKTFSGRYVICVQGGRKKTGTDPISFAQNMERLGAGEILLNSIDQDGTWEGYDFELIKQVTNAVNIPVIVCGGAGKVEHFQKAIHQGGASAVAAGSMFLYRSKGQGVLINYPTSDELQNILN